MPDNRLMIINKFGGAIMGSLDMLNLARTRVKEQLQSGQRPIVVVSAFKDMTDKFVAVLNSLNDCLAEKKEAKPEEIINDFVQNIRCQTFQIIEGAKFTQEVEAKIKQEEDNLFEEIREDLITISRFGVIPIFEDKILSYGEKISCIFFEKWLEQIGIKSTKYTGEEMGIITDDNHLDADINYNQASENAKNIINSLDQSVVPVITGFVGKNKKGQTTTLGRGGSDTTACFLGAALDADRVNLWKEVDGVLTTDPKIAPKAKTIDYISHEEAEESGKVVCDKAIQYLKLKNIPSCVVSIYDPEKKTEIGADIHRDKGVKIISSKKNLTLLIVTDDGVKEEGFLYQITKIFKQYTINMVLIRNTRDSLYIVVENNGKVKKAIEDLEDMHYQIKTTACSMVTVIGNLDWDIVNRFNKKLNEIEEETIIGAFPYKDCVRLETIVQDKDVEEIIRQLHQEFIEK